MRAQGRAIALRQGAAAQSSAGAVHNLQRRCACGNHALGGDCEGCREQADTLQARAAGEISAIPRIVHEVLHSPGQPLDSSARSIMEQRFGYDFSLVRIHTDERAARSAREVNARAYTVGRDIAFGSGQFIPESEQGERLLAHELAHVVQQGRTASHGPTDAAELERAADSAAYAATTGGAPIPVSGASPVRLARQDERATFGNLPAEVPGPGTRFILQQIDGAWMEVRPNGVKSRATGTYAFVIQKGKIWAVKPSGAMGADRGHTEAAAGGRVEYAGLVTFGSSKNQRGIVREWSNASGHYLPVREFKDVAVAAGLPDDRFKAFEGPRPPVGPQAQLPVFQEKKGTTLVKADERGNAPATSAADEAKPPQTSTTASAPPNPATSATPAKGGSGGGQPGVAPPMTGAQGQRVYGGAPSRPIDVPQSNRAAARGAAAMALMAAMDKLGEIGKAVQDKDARTKLLSVRQEIIDVLNREPGVGAVIELQFLEPEHRFQDIYWARTTAANAGKPTIVANPEARQPTSTFIYVEPMRSAKPGAAPTGPVPKEAKTGEEFIALYGQARGADLVGASTGRIAVEMYDAVQHGNRQFGFTDVQAGVDTIRISDAALGTIEAAVAALAERSVRRRLARLKGGIDAQQARLSEKLKDWFGGAIKLTGHELDPARAHFAAAENYTRDKKYGPASESIDAGDAQVEEVWAALFEYDNGHRPVAPLIW